MKHFHVRTNILYSPVDELTTISREVAIKEFDKRVADAPFWYRERFVLKTRKELADRNVMVGDNIYADLQECELEHCSPKELSNVSRNNLGSTVVIQIGNSDNKLTQSRWSEFFKAVHLAVTTHASQIHYCGFSDPVSQYQNAAWIFEIDEGESQFLYQLMKSYAGTFNQDSIAWTEGKTIFCDAKPKISKVGNEINYDDTLTKSHIASAGVHADYPESNVG